MRLLSTFLFILFSSLLTAAPANYFVPNKGQLSDMKGNKLPDIKYKYEGEGLNLYFQRDKLIYHFIKVEDKQQQDFTPEDHENFRKGNMMAIGKKVYFYRLDLNFKDANKDVVIEEQDETGSVSNYYLNSCPDGILNVSHFGRLVYRNLYDGIDLAFYFAEGKLKYDFIVLPGADISKIKLEYVGAESLEKSSAGELVVKTPVATITEGSPYTFVNGTGIEVPSEYIVEGSTLSFEVNGSHAGEGIVIDPTVTWSTYYNNGSSSDTWTKPDFDNTGAFYNTGYTYYTTFPLINAGAGQYFDGTKDGITDLVVVKFSSTYTYTWATYYGGDGGEYVAGYTDYGKALAVDASNNVYFAGQTDGTTFPTYNPGGAFYQDQTKIHGETPFVVKLNSNGVRLWASMFQHENANTMSSGMRMNGIYSANNNLYFTGQIYRFNSNDAPIRSMAGAYNNPTWKGPQDVFIGRFTSGNALEWCTYLNDGGLANASYRQGCDLTMDNSGNLWFVGRHTSSAANAGHYLLNPGGGAYYQGVNNGDQDLIITKFNSSMNVVYSTYYGGNDQDIPSMVECNSTGDAVFTLRACRSTNFPVFDPGGGAYYQPVKAYISAFDSDAALVKLSTGGIRQWATYYGGSGGPSLFSGVGFDGTNNIYVFGSTQASNFPTQSEAGSYNDATLGGTGDVVLLKFSNGGVRQWSTFYGGSGTESLYSPKGEVLSSGCSLKLLSFPYSNSADYPTTNPGGGAFFESTALTANANAIMLFEETSAGGNSTAPTSASATAATVCSGGATTLSVTGGSLGAGAAWTWYSTSCGGTLVGTGATLVVNPTSTTTYYVRAEGTCNTTTCASVTVTVNASSTAPTSASATAATVCSGGATTLSVTGGSLGAGAAWTWYSTSCGGTLVGTGATLVVNPTATTTYYVRAEGTCNTTTCASVTVTVNASSTAPTSASATAATVCSGGATTLSVTGGSLGAGASWTWYSASCGGTLVGTGATLVVNPTATTTYYVRAEGTCNTTTCASVTVTVDASSTAPTSASATAATVCSGGATTLSVTGGSLGAGASWTWYSASCGGTLVGTGATLVVNPTSTTTYYVRAEGTCNTTTCASVTVTVDASSTAPTSASATAATVCSGGATTLSVTGGSLGAGATWTWYSASCGGTLVGAGATLVVNPTATTTYYVRAEGTCNTTTCASVTVTVNASSTAPTSASATAATVCSGGATTLSVTGGSLGAGAAWTWYSTSCGGTLVGTGATLVVNPTATTTYYVRAEGTCNTTTCASVTVTVDASSTAPTSASASAPALCGAGSSTLSVSGGSLGAGASWTWYEGSCNGTPAGTGNSITVSPTSTTTYFVNAVGTCNTTICESVTVTVSTPSTAPTSVSGTQSTVCSGVSSTLTVNGGSLGTGATWSWYSASCGGTLQGTGTSITVTPGSTTTYYVRAEGACNTTTCESFTVTVDSLSSAPTSVTASVMSVCPTGSSTLGITGGSLGTGASWNWYEGSCTGTLIGTGSSIVVSPSATTSYFVKAEGLCNTTACEQVTITLNTLSTESTTASSNVSSICPSGSATLTTGGGSLGTNAVWNWYESSCGVTLAGSGSSIAVSPAVTTTYFVRAEGDCNSTVCDTVVVIVDEQSVAPVSITSSSPSVCTGNNVTLYVNGGILGTGASWNWYSGSCNSTVIGTGDSLTIPVNAATDYFVNAVGACNTTSCSQISIAVTPGSTLPTSLNLSADTVCPGSPVTITMSGEALEPGATWTWYSTNCGGTSIGTGNSIVVYPASATTYFVRAEGGSCGNSACTQVTVNVHVASSDPVNASSNTTLVCSGSSVDLSVSGGTVGTDAQYTWYEGSCNSAPIGNGSTLTVNPTVNTTYYVNLAGLCNTTNCQQVTISMEQQNVAPTGILANDTNLCTSSSITLAVDGGILGSGAQWTWYENACNGTVVGSGSSISVSPSAATTYYVSAIGGCNAIPCVSESIVVTPVAAAWTAPSGSLCSSVSAVDLNTYLSTGTPTGGSWIGQGVSGTMFDPSGLNGSITISYVLGSGICKDSVANTIQILASPVAPVVTASNDSVCSGNDVILDASGSGTGVIYEAYDAAVSGTLLGTMPLTVNPTSTITYYIQSVNSSGCVNDGGRQPVVIFTSAEPAANAGSDVMLCLGESTTLSASGGGSYLWSNGETQASTTVTPSADSTFIVAVTVDGCTASDSVVVNVVMSTDVEAGDDHATTDHSVEIKIDVASNDQGDPASVSITTSPLGGTATVNAEGDIVYTPSPTFAGTDSIVYSICHLSCASICTTATVYIIVNKEVTLSVPGGISPNGDGINDEFRIRGLEKYPENTLIIFNRWGDEVFSAAPYQNNWKGQSENAKLKLLGNEVVDGTYFYILRLSPEDKGMNGTIELIRK